MERTTHFFTDLPQELSLQIINNLSDEALIKTFLQPIYHSGRKLALQIIFLRDTVIARQFQENWLRAVLIEDRLSDYKDVFTKRLMQRALISQNISANLRILLIGTKLILSNSLKEASIKALRFFADFETQEVTGDLILILSRLGQTNILNTIGANHSLPFEQVLIIFQLQIKHLKLSKQEDRIIKLCLAYLSLNKIKDKHIKTILTATTNCLSQPGLLSLIKTLLADQRHRYDEHTIHLIKKCDVCFDDLIKHGIFEILNSHSKENYRSQQNFNILLNKTLNVLNFEAVFSYFFAKKSNIQFFFSNFLSASCILLATEEGRLIESRLAQLIWCYIEKDITIIDILSEKTIKSYAALLTNESLAHYFKCLIKHSQLSLAIELLSDCWYAQAIQRGFLLLEQVIGNLQNYSAEEVSKAYRFLKAFADKNIPERVVAADPSLPSTKNSTTKLMLPDKISDLLWGIDKNIILQDKLTSSGVVKLLDHLLPFLSQALAKHCGDLVLNIMFSPSKNSHYYYNIYEKIIKKIIKNNFYTQNISPYLFELVKKSELIESLASYLEEPYLDELFQAAVNALSDKKTIPNLFKFCQLAIKKLPIEKIESLWFLLTKNLETDKNYESYYEFCEAAFKAKKISQASMQQAFNIIMNEKKLSVSAIKLLIFIIGVIDSYDFEVVFNVISDFKKEQRDPNIWYISLLAIKKVLNTSSCDVQIVLGWLIKNLWITALPSFKDSYQAILELVTLKLTHEQNIELLNHLKNQLDINNIDSRTSCALIDTVIKSFIKTLAKQYLTSTFKMICEEYKNFLTPDFLEKAKLLADKELSETLLTYLLSSKLITDTISSREISWLIEFMFELTKQTSQSYISSQLPLWFNSDTNVVQELGIKTLTYLLETKSPIIIANLAKYVDCYFYTFISDEKLSKFIERKEEYKEPKENKTDRTNVKWRREIPDELPSTRMLTLANLIKSSNLENAEFDLYRKEMWRREPREFDRTSISSDNTISKSNKFYCLLKLTQLIEVKDYAHYLTKFGQLLKNNSKLYKLLSLYQLNILISQIDINTVNSLYPLCINLLKAMFFLFKESNLALKANAVKIYALILSKLNVKTACDFIKKLIGSEIPGARRSSIFVIYFYFKEVEKQPTFDILLNTLIDDVMKLVVDANFTVRKTISEEIGYIAQFFNESTLTTFLNNLINYHAQYKANEGIKKSVAITLHAALTNLSSTNLSSALNHLLTKNNEELSLVSYKVINKKFWRDVITYTYQDFINVRTKGALAKELRAKLNVETKRHLFAIELNYAWIKYLADDVKNLKVLPVTSILVSFEAEPQLMLNIKNAIYRQISQSKIESRFAFFQLLSRTYNKHLLKIIANIEAELFANLAFSEALLCFDKISNTSIFIDYLAKNYMKWVEADLDKITDILHKKFTAESFTTIFPHLPSVFIHKIVNKCIQSYDMTDRYTIITLALPYLRADYSKQLFASLLKETNFNLSHDVKTILLNLATQLFINEDFEPFQHLESAQDSQIMVQLFDSLQTSEQLNCLKK